MKIDIKHFALAAAGATMLLTSCIGDLDTLPLNPSDSTSETVYGKDENGYLAGLTKLYFNFVSNDTTDLQVSDGGASELIRAFWTIQEVTADACKCAWENDAWVRAMNTDTWSDADNDATYAVYVRTLQGIAYVNEYLRQTASDKLSDRGVSSELAARIQSFRAEARFLRAYYYFLLFRQYGPVFIWGDQIADETIDAKSVDRHTVQENIDFMVGELDAIKNDLPVRTDDIGIDGKQWAGRVTRGAALALKSRILLYAASPLYNGCDLYKGQMQNIRGEFLFPQSKDETKWEAAAQAAWDVIELAETGLYDLYKDTEQTDEFTRYMSSYQGVRLKPWNKETIWGWWSRSGGYSWLGGTGGLLAGAMPGMTSGGASGVVYQGYGGIQPSLKLVDSYPMYTTGRYPVTGYQGENDMSKPIVDPQSGYQATGFTEGYKQPGIDWGDGIKAHNSCINRDPRYYACLVPNGFWWPNKTENIKFTCYNNDACTNKWNAGEGGGITRVGYVWRRLLETNKSLREAKDYTSMQTVYPAFRLAEIYLNYAEACNEKPQRDETAALEYLNRVRARVGLKKIEVAYPEIKGNKELLRWCIQKERMVEFGLEAMRHYDACRWMIAKEEYPSENWTLHVSATTYEESYERVHTDYVGAPAVFRDKDYLHPINAAQMAEMTNMTQNYGH